MEYQFISLELEITAFFYLFDLFYNVLYLLVCVCVCVCVWFLVSVCYPPLTRRWMVYECSVLPCELWSRYVNF